MTRKAGIVVVTYAPGFTNTLFRHPERQHVEFSPDSDRRRPGGPCPRPARSPGYAAGADHRAESSKKSSYAGKRNASRNTSTWPFAMPKADVPARFSSKLPIDVLDADVDPDSVTDFKTVVKSRPADPADARAMMELVRNSVKTGDHGRQRGLFCRCGAENNAALPKKQEYPYSRANSPADLFRIRIPCVLNRWSMIRPGCAPLATVDSDCVILLGNRLCLYTGQGGLFRKDAQSYSGRHPAGRDRQESLGGSCRFWRRERLMAECNDWIDREQAGEALKQRFSGWVEELPQKCRDRQRIRKISFREHQGAHQPRQAGQGKSTSSWIETTILSSPTAGSAHLDPLVQDMRQPWAEMHSGLFGCLGGGLAYANAAKLVRPESRVMLCIGDGSIGFNFMEILTSLNQHLPIVIVIGNNSLWGMTANSMKLKFKHYVPGTVELGFVPYHKFMEPVGVKGFLVERPEEIRPALEASVCLGEDGDHQRENRSRHHGPRSAALAMAQARNFNGGRDQKRKSEPGGARDRRIDRYRRGPSPWSWTGRGSVCSLRYDDSGMAISFVKRPLKN